MKHVHSALILSILAAAAAACGGDDDPGQPDASGLPRCDDPPGPIATGDPDGHAEPLGAGPTEARAGRLEADELPPVAAGFLTWKAGDFVLANDKVALVIEDVGHSDLYDPWGGRPVGVARVEGGALVDAAGDFGEVFLLASRSTVVTTAVTVINDGSDGNPAVIRASGRLAPLPFLSHLLSALYFDDLRDIEAALDYTLAPGAEVIDVTYRFASPRGVPYDSGAVLHGFMYTDRMRLAVPGDGFTADLRGAAWLQLVDDDDASWAYQVPGDVVGQSYATSGFIGGLTDAYTIAACGTSEHAHARIVIGGPGLDGLEQARARVEGRTLRAITGTVTAGGAPLPGARVHATTADGGYLTRVTTAADGSYTLHVDAAADVVLTAFHRGYATATVEVAADETAAAIALPGSGAIHVTVTEDGGPVPARVQILPAGGSAIPSLPEEFGEPSVTGGRLHVEFPTTGEVTVPVPPGDWDVVVSRGYEYEIVEQGVTVTAGATVDVDAALERVVDTTDQQCGDFHIHTARSNDSGDDVRHKLRSAVADGLELPVRTDHEWVGSFADEIEELGVQAYAYAVSSIEMTSFQIWGHMNVFPLEADPTQANAGAPLWQRFPSADSPDIEVEILSPRVVFEAVRQRPESPVIIINHPRGSFNYFDYVGLDPATGLVDRADDWDEEFEAIEVFNDADWLDTRDGTVRDWFTLLNQGRRVFAVGSSDSHSVSGSPLGYPRTCIDLGTDDPSALTAELVRDQVRAGASTISGGVYLDAAVGAAGPGDTATGTGPTATVQLRVQAATWIDVDAIDVVVDGVTVQTIPIAPGDADPGNPVVRWQDTIDVAVAAGGSWVVLAAYGDAALDPVHPGRRPFGVTNPIWLER